MRKCRKEFARRLLAVHAERGQAFEHRGESFMLSEATQVMNVLEPPDEEPSDEEPADEAGSPE